MRKLLNFIPVVFLAGCMASPYGCTRSDPDTQVSGGAGTPPSLHGEPSEIVAAFASYGAWIGCALLFAAVVLAVFGRRKIAGMCAATGGGFVIAAPILSWVGSNLWWISAVCGVVGAVFAGAFAWFKAIPWIETQLGKDLNFDNKIGAGDIATAPTERIERKK